MMYKLSNCSKVLVFSMISILLSGCSLFMGPDKQFDNQITGAYEIAEGALNGNSHSNSCESKSQKEKEACQKQVDALVKSIENSKNK